MGAKLKVQEDLANEIGQQIVSVEACMARWRARSEEASGELLREQDRAIDGVEDVKKIKTLREEIKDLSEKVAAAQRRLGALAQRQRDNEIESKKARLGELDAEKDQLAIERADHWKHFSKLFAALAITTWHLAGGDPQKFIHRLDIIFPREHWASFFGEVQRLQSEIPAGVLPISERLRLVEIEKQELKTFLTNNRS